MSESDRYWMAQALALGATVDGTTSPNPRVGCLIVRDDEVVGRGCHRAPGGPHAEALALSEAGSLARGSTLYVNLEPCVHHGRTPPCSDRLLESGVRRVVASIQDPDPRVDGRGFAQLRDAGVEVEVGALADEAERVNEPFLIWHRLRRPMVTLKAAGSLDGMISGADGEARWISGVAARRFAHRLRLRHDAILVGAGTVRRDDPRLTVRLDAGVVERRKVVLSSSLDLDPQGAVFRGEKPDSPAVIVYTENPDPESAARLRPRAEVRRVASGEGGLDIAGVLDDLGRDGIQSVLVEGGGKTIGSFLQSGLAQRIAIFVSGRLLGSRGGTPLVDLPAVEHPRAGWSISREQLIPLGADLLWMGRVRRQAGAAQED